MLPEPSAWLNFMSQSPRLSWPVISRPTRSLPHGSCSKPWTSAVRVIGFVTPCSVSCASIAKVSSSTGRIAVATKVSSGWLSASKKSAERRCASRWGSFVSTEATCTVPDAVAVARSSPITSVPSNSRNAPLTVAMPRCLTENSTFEWLGSTLQVPVSGVVVVVTVADIGTPLLLVEVIACATTIAHPVPQANGETSPMHGLSAGRAPPRRRTARAGEGHRRPGRARRDRAAAHERALGDDAGDQRRDPAEHEARPRAGRSRQPAGDRAAAQNGAWGEAAGARRGVPADQGPPRGAGRPRRPAGDGAADGRRADEDDRVQRHDPAAHLRGDRELQGRVDARREGHAQRA